MSHLMMRLATATPSPPPSGKAGGAEDENGLVTAWHSLTDWADSMGLMPYVIAVCAFAAVLLILSLLADG